VVDSSLSLKFCACSSEGRILTSELHVEPLVRVSRREDFEQQLRVTPRTPWLILLFFKILRLFLRGKNFNHGGHGVARRGRISTSELHVEPLVRVSRRRRFRTTTPCNSAYSVVDSSLSLKFCACSSEGRILTTEGTELRGGEDFNLGTSRRTSGSRFTEGRFRTTTPRTPWLILLFFKILRLFLRGKNFNLGGHGVARRGRISTSELHVEPLVRVSRRKRNGKENIDRSIFP